MSSQYSIVHLRVKAETEFGQVVHVSGSAFTLGNFATTEVRREGMARLAQRKRCIDTSSERDAVACIESIEWTGPVNSFGR